METVEYHLKGNLEYANKGETVAARFISINEFTAKHLNYTAPIKQMCLRAFNDISEGYSDEEIKEAQESKSETETTGSDLMQALYMSNEDVSKFFVYMRELLTSPNIAYVDGEVKLTKPIFEELSQEDVEGVCGEYAMTFILASVLRDSQRQS